MNSATKTTKTVKIGGGAAALLLCQTGLAANVGVGAGKAFNPDISANILGLYQHDTLGSNDRTAGAHNGLLFQEAELQFVADVDPYFRANALFSVAQKPGTTEFGLDPEEVYFESIALPVVTLKAGKFKAALGKHNQLHTHAYPFIDAPLINKDLLGDEGINEMGISAAALLPLPWFSELTVQGLGNSNTVLYNSPSSADPAVVAYFKNLWDLSDSLTMELGLYGTGANNAYGSNTVAYGSDLIFKWRPSEGGKYSALIWQSEYLSANIQGGPLGGSLGGLASWLQWQFAERWWAQARAEYEGLPLPSGASLKTKQSALVGFFPSEFSGFRLQLDHLVASGQHDYIGTLQWNISIGAHPAHAY